jgi:hypothetical protein
MGVTPTPASQIHHKITKYWGEYIFYKKEEEKL